MKRQAAGENCIMRSFITCMYSSPSKNDQVKKDEMGVACSTNLEKRNASGYWWKSQKERHHWEDQDVGR
jgi:hypothetical protein